MEATALLLKACPRCRTGDLYRDLDGETYCLQCSHRTTWTDRIPSLIGSNCSAYALDEAQVPRVPVPVSHQARSEAAVIEILGGKPLTWFGTLGRTLRTGYRVRVSYLRYRCFQRSKGRTVIEAVPIDITGIGFEFRFWEITPASTGRKWWSEFSAAFSDQVGFRLVGAYDWFTYSLECREALLAGERA